MLLRADCDRAAAALLAALLVAGVCCWLLASFGELDAVPPTLVASCWVAERALRCVAVVCPGVALVRPEDPLAAVDVVPALKRLLLVPDACRCALAPTPCPVAVPADGSRASATATASLSQRCALAGQLRTVGKVGALAHPLIATEVSSLAAVQPACALGAACQLSCTSAEPGHTSAKSPSSIP